LRSMRFARSSRNPITTPVYHETGKTGSWNYQDWTLGWKGVESARRRDG
jgi:hypothetical protein